MKILATSDFHGNVEASKKVALKARDIKANVIAVCGDITHFGSIKDAENVLSPLTSLQIPVLYVPGNCDPLSLLEAKIEGGSCIHGKCEAYSGLSFIGAGSVPADKQHPSPFDISEEEILNALTQSSKNCPPNQKLIVVAHSPPVYTNLDKAYFGGHVGSSNLRLFVEQKQPSIVFCGHIHEAKGIDYIGKTLIANTGPARHGDYAVAVFNEKVEVQLQRL